MKTQVILVLDADDTLPDGELLEQIPPATHRREVIRLSDFSPPPVVREGEGRGPVDWFGLGFATSRLVNHAIQQAKARNHPTEFVVAGRAPLPCFLQVGFYLSAWAHRVILANRRKDKTWDIIDVDAEAAKAGSPFFDVVTPMSSTSHAEGVVGVYVSCLMSVDESRIREFIHQRGDRAAGVIEIRTSDRRAIDASNAPLVAQELVEHFTRIASSYPCRSGIALFVAGPATLAYVVGRAINSKVFHNTQIANFSPPGYEYCFTLPLGDPPGIVLSEEPEAVSSRQKCFEAFVGAVEELRSELSESDLPAKLDVSERQALLARLDQLTVDSKPTAEFSFSVPRGVLSVGTALLEALRQEPDSTVRQIAQLFLLHELYHLEQGIESTNYYEVGRTGIALEEIDFHADAVSLETLLRYWERIDPMAEGEPTVRGRLETLVRSALSGMRAFDRIAHGEVLERLPERRLRRYLIWHMQLARAQGVRSLEDVEALFASRLIVELGPLKGTIDARYEKLVASALPDTQMAIVLGGELCRIPKKPMFDPEEIVEAVKTFDVEVLERVMEIAVNECRQMLMAWRADL